MVVGFRFQSSFCGSQFFIGSSCRRFGFGCVFGRSGDCLGCCFGFGGGAGCCFDRRLLDFRGRLERSGQSSHQFFSLLERFLRSLGGFGIVAIYAWSLSLQIETVSSGRKLVFLQIDLYGRVTGFPVNFDFFQLLEGANADGLQF